MSVRYQAVNWNPQKRRYDALLGLGVAGFLGIFTAVSLARPNATLETALIRGLGAAALVLLHVILCIGPLCRLDRRFLPLLYNRRHLGVAMAILAAGHAAFALLQYHGGGEVNPLASLLEGSPETRFPTEFPFELFGLTALLILAVMAATSHDYWLSVLTPPVWKALHMGVYLAYGLLLLHVALGPLQAEGGWFPDGALLAGAMTVFGLHLAAGVREWGRDAEAPAGTDGWVDAGPVDAVPEGRALGAVVAGERVAIYRHRGRLSAVSGVCRHQNGPLAEGKIIDGCITCPWHGYQYEPESGASPAPFTEKVPTFRTRVQRGRVLVHPAPLPAGTRVPSALIEEPDSEPAHVA